MGGGVFVGKVPPNELKMLEFLERQAAEKRKQEFEATCEAIFFDLGLDATNPKVAEGIIIPDTRDRCRELLEGKLGRQCTAREAEAFLDFTTRTFRPSEHAKRERALRRELEEAIDKLFKSWKDKTEENFNHQMGRKVTKTEASLALSKILGRLPNKNETDRMWLRKELEVGKGYDPIDFPFG